MTSMLLRLLLVLVGCAGLGACLIEIPVPEARSFDHTIIERESGSDGDAELDAILADADSRIAAAPATTRVGDAASDHAGHCDLDHDHELHDHEDHDHEDHDHDHEDHERPMNDADGAGR